MLALGEDVYVLWGRMFYEMSRGLIWLITGSGGFLCTCCVTGWECERILDLSVGIFSQCCRVLVCVLCG